MVDNEIVFDKKVIDKMLGNAGRLYPKEGCGLLLGRMDRYKVHDVCIMKNQAVGKRAKEHFVMDPLSLYEAERGAEREGCQILGFYHSHPDAPAILSGQDKEYMIPGMVYVVLSVWGRKTRGIRAYVKWETDGDIVPVSINITE